MKLLMRVFFISYFYQIISPIKLFLNDHLDLNNKSTNWDYKDGGKNWGEKFCSNIKTFPNK